MFLPEELRFLEVVVLLLQDLYLELQFLAENKSLKSLCKKAEVVPLGAVGQHEVKFLSCSRTPSDITEYVALKNSPGRRMV